MTAARAAVQSRRAEPERPVAPSRSSAKRSAAPAFFSCDDGDEIRVNLADVPRMSLAVEGSMHIEGLKPTLLSRLIGLFMPKL